MDGLRENAGTNIKKNREAHLASILDSEAGKRSAQRGVTRNRSHPDWGRRKLYLETGLAFYTYNSNTCGLTVIILRLPAQAVVRSPAVEKMFV